MQEITDKAQGQGTPQTNGHEHGNISVINVGPTPMEDFCNRIAQMKSEIFDMEWYKESSVKFKTKGKGDDVDYDYSSLEYILERTGPLWPKYLIEPIRTYRPAFEYGGSGNLKATFILDVELLDLKTGTLRIPGGNILGAGGPDVIGPQTSAYKLWERQFFHIPLKEREEEGSERRTFDSPAERKEDVKVLTPRPQPPAQAGRTLSPKPIQTSVRGMPQGTRPQPASMTPEVRTMPPAGPVNPAPVKPVPKAGVRPIPAILGNTVARISDDWDNRLIEGSITDEEHKAMKAERDAVTTESEATAFIEKYGMN